MEYSPNGSPIKSKCPCMWISETRYTVVKWVKNTDKHVGWASCKASFADPETGAIISGSLLINGDLRKIIKKMAMRFKQPTI